MKLLFRYIMYHLWEWRHRRKPKYTNEELALIEEADRLRDKYYELEAKAWEERSEKENIKMFLTRFTGIQVTHKPERLADEVSLIMQATVQEVPDFICSTLVPTEDWENPGTRRYIMDKLLEAAVNDLYKKGFKPDLMTEVL